MKNILLTLCLFLITTSWNVMLHAQNNQVGVEKTITNLPALRIEGKILIEANCIDSEDGSIQVVAKGGQQPYQYFEINGTEITKRLEVKNTFTKLNPDTYTLKVVDADGNEISTELTLKAVQPAPTAEFEIENMEDQIKFINTSANSGRWAWHFNEVVSYEAAPILSATDDFQEVCLIASNGCNAKDMYCETINVKNELSSALAPTNELNQTLKNKEDLTNFEVAVFPNPTTDRLTIRYSNTMELENIEVYNMTGKLVQTAHPQSFTETTLSLGSIPAGMYIVQINGVTSTETLKINKAD